MKIRLIYQIFQWSADFLCIALKVLKPSMPTPFQMRKTSISLVKLIKDVIFLD